VALIYYFQIVKHSIRGAGMSREDTIWFDKPERRARLADPQGRERMAHFGYRKVPEDEKVHWVLNHFNTVAKRYDFMNTLLSFGIHHLWKRQAVRMLGLKEGDWVIDLCGGTGDLSILAASAVGPSGRVVLYDINWTMMAVGRPKVWQSRGGERVLYVQGDAEQISFPGGSFEAAMVGFGIRNLTHVKAGAMEIHRILKPGGKLMCLEFSKPTAPLFRWLYDIYSLYLMPVLGEVLVGSRQAYTYLPESIRMFLSPEELSTILREAGFSEITYQKLTNGIAVVHLAKRDGA
jgi:demethylmenaquinone methyltransferase/2-methoxy-6-polyprenyl-1,4-benzoquinol methylase